MKTPKHFKRSGIRCGILLVILFKLAFFFPPVLNAQESALRGPVTTKIVSWNIQMLPNGFAFLSKALRKKQHVRIDWILEHCRASDYDVIVFQEVFDVNMRHRLRKHLRELFPYQVSTRCRRGRLTSNGILIVSRVPMKYVDHVIYERGVNSDRLAAKGCTLVELEKEGVRFQIAGTHLQAGEDDAPARVRREQFRQIRELIDRHHSAGIPVFVIGDMNTEKTNQAEYLDMLEAIAVDDASLNDTEPWTIDGKNTWTPDHRSKQLDYILLQARQTLTRILHQKIIRPRNKFRKRDMDLSDHYGIAAEVEIYN